jgi:ABC-2 type transport system permease protein
VVAFITGAASCFFFYYGFQFLSDLNVFKSVNSSVAGIGINAHYESISLGVVDTRDILYFISFVVITLLITRLILSIKRK